MEVVVKIARRGGKQCGSAGLFRVLGNGANYIIDLRSLPHFWWACSKFLAGQFGVFAGKWWCNAP